MSIVVEIRSKDKNILLESKKVFTDTLANGITSVIGKFDHDHVSHVDLHLTCRACDHYFYRDVAVKNFLLWDSDFDCYSTSVEAHFDFEPCVDCFDLHISITDDEAELEQPAPQSPQSVLSSNAEFLERRSQLLTTEEVEQGVDREVHDPRPSEIEEVYLS